MVSKVTEQEITAGYLVNWWSIKSILLFLHRVHEAIVKNLTQSTLLAIYVVLSTIMSYPKCNISVLTVT